MSLLPSLASYNLTPFGGQSYSHPPWNPACGARRGALGSPCCLLQHNATQCRAASHGPEWVGKRLEVGEPPTTTAGAIGSSVFRAHTSLFFSSDCLAAAVAARRRHRRSLLHARTDAVCGRS